MPATIESGSSISHYRVLSPLGSGGMGEVYVARDLTLERTVALKILPPRLTKSEERLRRFVQEAKSASSLSHPHIVTIHEIGHAEVTSSDGTEDSPKSDPIHYIAMELIDGATIRAKIHHERTDLKQLIAYLAQSAEGLAKAHAAGIIHRDLKPDNIMVTKDGYAKVLDFGLAKLQIKTAAESTEGPTEVRDETREGAVLGTVGYMSPEQVQGRQTDHRADIFSFGCILYEAATKQRPFRADSDVDVMHKILHDKPEPIDEANPNVPSDLRRIIRRCLAKDPDKRYQSMKDLALELGDLVDEWDDLAIGGDSKTSTSSGISNPTLPAAAARRNPYIALGALALAIIAVAAIVLVMRRGTASKAVAPADSFASMKITRVTTSGNVVAAAISSDNRYLANVIDDHGKSALFVRQIATGSDVQIVPSSPLRILGVTFSPDGNYLYYVQAEDESSGYSVVYQVPSLGGTPRKIIWDVDTPVSFSPDGKRFAFVRGYPQLKESAVVVASIDGGAEQKLAIRKAPESFPLLHASWSPDGRQIAVVGGDSSNASQVVTVDAVSGKQQVVRGGLQWAFAGIEWLPDGSGIVVSAADRSASAATQISIVTYPGGELRKVTNDLNEYGPVSVTTDGKTIATIQGNAYSNIWSLIPGERESEKQLTTGQQETLAFPNPVPDGSMIVQSISNGQIGVYRIASTGTRTPLTAASAIASSPSVDREARTMVYGIRRDGVTHVAKSDADGSGAVQVTNGKGEFNPKISPDGTWFVYRDSDGSVNRMSIGGGAPVKLASLTSSRPDISPDGKYVLVTPVLQIGDRARRCFVVIPATGGAPIAQIERDGRAYAAFSPAGDAVDYVYQTNGQDNVWRQPLSGGAPKQLTNFKDGTIGWFAWKPDGKTLLVTRGQAVSDVVLISDFR